MLTVQAANAQAADGAPAPAAPAQTVVPTAQTSTTAAVQGGAIKGTVKAGETPLPGVAMTATTALTGKKYATTTDIDGRYQLQVPRNGRYVIRTELTGFAAATQQVVVNASSENGGLPAQTAEFKMELASRVPQQQETATQPGAAVPSNTVPGAAGRGAAGPGVRGSVRRVGRGTQALSIQNNADADTL